MRHHFTFIFSAMLWVAGLTSCDQKPIQGQTDRRHDFPHILDIAYTPDSTSRCTGWFTDAGAWTGFTLPQTDKWVNGFCGPFSLDMNRRQWLAKSAVTVNFVGNGEDTFTPDSVCYFPGELYLSAHNGQESISQQLHFINASTALLGIRTDKEQKLCFTGEEWGKDIEVQVEQNKVIARHTSGETVLLTFSPNYMVSQQGNNYQATAQDAEAATHVTISFYTNEKELLAGKEKAPFIISKPEPYLEDNRLRWEGYLSKILRKDMKPEYDRIAVKAVTTLISNWKTRRGGLLHDGIVPSHAVSYFVGFWAWDSWRFSAALAKFAPELAKDNIRAMFDYQQPDGMIIDCIYTDPKENNARDSKPPLVSWAVDEIFTHTNDTAFVSEMYPQLMAYYKWWYEKRDHNRNGMCEYGSTDGTVEAAAWESGMDNAIRFDDAQMLKNEGFEDAWSFDQESVDLNAYLALECKLLKKFAALLGTTFDAPDYSEAVADYFFDPVTGFFHDKRIKDGTFIEEPGCEAYTPLWTQVATKEQVERMKPLLTDTTKFSTYIPFPTIAADNPKYNPRGYWRGPIWLDQTYFAVKGLRNYGYHELADQYTLQVFDRLQGLKEGAPIHENYGTHTGERLKAPHFSWSSSHLLMFYDDYGKDA